MERTSRSVSRTLAAIACALAFTVAFAAPQLAFADEAVVEEPDVSAVNPTPAVPEQTVDGATSRNAAQAGDNIADSVEPAAMGESQASTPSGEASDAQPSAVGTAQTLGQADETDAVQTTGQPSAADTEQISEPAPANDAPTPLEKDEPTAADGRMATDEPAAADKPAASGGPTAADKSTVAAGPASADKPAKPVKPTAAATAAKPEATKPVATAKPTATKSTSSIKTQAAAPAKMTAATAKAAAKTTAEKATKKAAVTTQATKAPQLQYRAHVQKVGWQPWVTSGKMGTSGRSLRVEALQIKLLNNPGGSIQYQAYVQGIGWQNVFADGDKAGTSGQARRLEALRIALIGDISKTYDIQYRGHVQGIGWQKWTKNGATAGTVGENRRLEALEIKLVKKAKKTSDNEGIVGVHYNSHVQSIGWQPFVRDGAVAGTSGRSLRVEATRIYLDKGKYSGNLSYRAHVQNIGWQKWGSEGSLAGTHHQSKRVEAFQIKLTGEISKYYDIAYRTHAQSVGWQPWTYNGGVAGTHGRSLRLEALQIKLIKKGTNQTVSDGVYYITTTADVSSAIDDPDGKTNQNVQAQIHTINANSLNQRYMLRTEGKNLVSLQSVASGLYLADKGGKVVQVGDSKAAANRWKVSFDGGFVLTNASSGKVLSVNGSKVTNGSKIVTAKKGSYDNAKRWTFAGTRLIPNGYFEIQSRLGGYLNVEDGAYYNGANIQTASRNNSGSQRFHVTATGSDYRIDNCKSFRTLDVSGASKSAGANVIQYGWESHPAQKWSAEMNRAGYIVFTNKNSGKALQVAGGSNVQLGNRNVNAGSQNWRLVQSSNWSLTGDSALDRGIASELSEYTSLSECFYHVAGDFSYISGSKFYGGSAYVDESDTVEFAKEMLSDGGGNCYRFASLFMWLARGLGYDADTMSGWVVGYSGNQAPHGWTQVYEDGDTYVCDPDMQHEMPGYGWYWTTYDTSPTAYYFW